MIIFGVCIGEKQRYESVALPRLEGLVEASSRVLTSFDHASIASAYNDFLQHCRELDDVEALILVHEDVELLDPAFLSKVRRRLAEPDIAVIGVVGAKRTGSLAWWNGRTFGRVGETRGHLDLGPTPSDVDVVDGLLLVLSPWAVEHLNFDEVTFTAYHGYDADICMQARAAGKRVVVEDLDVFHRTRGGYGDKSAFDRADRQFRRKWADELPTVTPPVSLVRHAQRLHREMRAMRVAFDPGIAAAKALVHRLALRIRPATRNPTPPSRAGTTDRTLTASHIQCPVCGGEERLNSEDLIRIIDCPSCGTGITWPPPSRDVDGDGIFVETYGGSRLSRRPQWLREAQARLAWLEMYVADGVLLEIGSATGEFVREATVRGFEAFGLETSRWAAREAQRFGARVETANMDEWRRRHHGQLVDAVAMFHVLEHVPDPSEMLQSVREVLQSDGLLFIEVPNWASPAARHHREQWRHASVDDHYHHFTEKSISQLVGNAGFEVIDVVQATWKMYDSADEWRRRRNEWIRDGIPIANPELLRLVARRFS